jgi:hypothetical protein
MRRRSFGKSNEGIRAATRVRHNLHAEARIVRPVALPGLDT